MLCATQVVRYLLYPEQSIVYSFFQTNVWSNYCFELLKGALYSPCAWLEASCRMGSLEDHFRLQVNHG